MNVNKYILPKLININLRKNKLYNQMKSIKSKILILVIASHLLRPIVRSVTFGF